MGIDIKNQHVFVSLPQAQIERCLGAFEQQLADEATRIIRRTRSGKDVDGGPFAPYSPAYARFRQSAGRQVSPPNLEFSGNMLSAITHEVKRTSNGSEGRIFFNSAREALKAAGNQVRRRFFGLADEQVRRIVKAMREAK
jgi:hypothetical protein